MTDDMDPPAVGDVVVLTRPTTDSNGRKAGPGAKGKVFGVTVGSYQRKYKVRLHNPDGAPIGDVDVPQGWVRKVGK